MRERLVVRENKMGDLKYKRDKGQDTYHPAIPIPATMDRPAMLPPPELTIIGDASEMKDKK